MPKPAAIVLEGVKHVRLQGEADQGKKPLLLMGGRMVEDDAEGWFEAGPIRGMTIRRNRFIACGIQINPRTHGNKPDEPVHENIRITEDYFESCGIQARNVKRLTVRSSRFSASRLPVSVRSSSEVSIGDDQLGVRQ